MKYAFSIIAMLLAISTSAQKAKVKPGIKAPALKSIVKPGKPVGFAVIKGHITNNTNELLDYNWEAYLGYKQGSLKIDKNGDFIQTIKLDGDMMEVYLVVNDNDYLILLLSAKDTVTLTWDAKDYKKTWAITANKPGLAAGIKKCDTHRTLFNGEIRKMRQAIADRKMPDSVKFGKINALYNKQIQSLLSGDVYTVTMQLAADIYFENCKLLLSNNLLPKYELSLSNPTKETGYVSVLNDVKAYRREYEEYYRNSAKYRDFMFDYVRFSQPFSYWGPIGETTKENSLPFAPAWRDYYSGLAAFHIIELRDWYLTKSIMEDFSYYSFTDASDVYKDFIPKVKTTFYADTLKTYYSNVQRLKPGGPAPQFTLKDENGKTVTLDSFKGKTVYIDFWGVYCGPCIYDITNNVPALHEKYKDKNIMFINICVDVNEKEWKESLKKLNLHGVNLLAEGWTKNPVNKAYGISAIPHYYLIDTEGKIVNNNANGPGEELYRDLDKLIK
ncbi:TlpA family protein disulfide reductase [Mucilaginibacter antarcticus]|uniref:TlpA family protein disulfide reductase n=1 Tax=Mucilaginibacter antarcticus TaxID=1855725 RepID=A0ABW5XTP0_9SPHI